METEFSWGRRPNYGSRLAEEAGWTPVYVRYNTGLRISQNGRSLAELLERTVADWPVEVEEIALIGHSMGGLVCRSAAHQAAEDGMAWVGRVRHVVSLGTPHRGAPLEEIVHVGSAALTRCRRRSGVARFLRRRSGGIRDLRRGSLVDEDWQGPRSGRAARRRVPGDPAARGRDALLRLASSRAARATRRPADRRHAALLECRALARARRPSTWAGGGHFALLNHPRCTSACAAGSA